MRKFGLFLIVSILLLMVSCSKYSLTNLNIGNAKTIQVDFFQNEAQLVEPRLSQLFTEELRKKPIRQTKLILVPSNGDLHFSGEIINYRIDPIGATTQQTASQNRLTITVNVRYINRLNDKNNFEKQFSFYSDFDANAQLIGGVLDNALDQIIERITQDILNNSLNNWET